MKTTTQHSVSKWCRFLMVPAVVLSAFSGVGCMTTYDAAGRPVQSVDPMVAVAGAAAAGLAGYAIANNRDDNHYYRGPGYYHGSYGGYAYRCPPARYYYRH
jgi:hypothetical protein